MDGKALLWLLLEATAASSSRKLLVIIMVCVHSVKKCLPQKLFVVDLQTTTAKCREKREKEQNVRVV